ncbi:MAG: hypothetical protein HYY91_05905 [Candidatus Omnitrophica bacterium]|nr:hypothetical protein [Candidatus Omnitrophota bacterium]
MWHTLTQGLLAFAKRVGEVQAWLILTVFYFLILAPVALLFKCAADPLRLRRAPGSIWHPKPPPRDLRQWAKAQF